MHCVVCWFMLSLAHDVVPSLFVLLLVLCSSIVQDLYDLRVHLSRMRKVLLSSFVPDKTPCLAF